MSSPESPTTPLVIRVYRRLISLFEAWNMAPLHQTFSWPLDAITAQIKPLPVLKLASFERCTCDQFDEGQAHLSVHTHETELHESKGVAISYAWGEFARERRRIGHFRDSPDEAVEMELGAEWRVSSVQERLAQLTEQHDGCWVDQICMPQKEEKTREKEEKIRQTLAAIPSIFRTLHVTVLLPGSLCGCLRKAFDECQAAKAEVDEQEASADLPSEASARLDTCMERLERTLWGGRCLNSNGACSWTKRLWTLQEFLYSKSCSLLFANQEVMECCEFEDSSSRVKPKQLNDYSRRLYEDLVNRRSRSREEGMGFLQQEHVSNWYSQHLMIRIKATDDSGLLLASLLLGDRQQWDVTDEQHPGPFIETLLSIAIEPRTATQAVDYILSFFPALDGYIVPANYNDLSPTELLEDALAQFFKLKKLFIPSLSPKGLSGSVHPSALLSPDIAATEIRDSTDIYGPLRCFGLVYVRSPARLPLRLPSVPTTTSLGQNAHNFDTWIEVRDWRDSSKIFLRFHKRFGVSWEEAVAKLESSSKSERVVGLMRILSEIPSDDRHKTRENIISTLNRMLPRLRDIHISAREVEKAIHALICEFLHLDATRCRQSGVRAIFSRWHGHRGVVQPGGEEQSTSMSSEPCVGLVNGQSFDHARSSGAELLTIGHYRTPETPIYEAVKVPGTSSPEYRIIGVWVPLDREIRVAEVGAIMVDEADEHNAYIV
ncbi:hypothetical protein LTR40_007664 [Exophiala xenobiotica]|nr:hypothetical protein LTR40_007664 [Exophiala xenobiotica]